MRSKPTIMMVLVCLVAAAAGQAAGTKTVKVDCAKGESLNAALEDKAEPLIIEISGVCEEEVVVRRNFVTLRGAEPGATIVGPESPTIEFGGGITVDGSSGVVLTDLLVRDGRRGVTVRRGGAASLERVTLQDHGATGLSVFGTSSVRVTDCTVQDNDRFGIAIWDNSSLELRGTTSANRNGLIGLLLSASHASFSSLTERIEANDNGYAGVFLQIAATAQVGSVVANDNGFAGFYMLVGGTWSGDLEATGNNWGVVVERGAYFEARGTVTGNSGFGIYGEYDVTLDFSGEISGNGGPGLWLDGTEARISDATVTDDVFLMFRTTVDFAGGNSVTGGISCDETVLTRGDVSCPAPLAPQGRGVAPALGESLGSKLELPTLGPFHLEK